MKFSLLVSSTNNAATTPPENMQFLYDNHGPYLKIYYDHFDRNQNDLPSFQSTLDGVNRNFMPNMNTQNSLPFQQMHQPQVPSKPPPTNVIHHLVSSLGPNKTGSYSPFGETIVNNVSMQPMEAPMMMPEPNIVNQAATQVTQNVSSVKKRIVAEVKPMRMSYSDVVSKNAANQTTNSTSNFGSTNSASSSPNTTLPVTSKNIKVDKSKFTNSFEKKSQDDKVKKSPINSVGSGNNSNNNNNANSSVPNPDRKSPTIAHSTKSLQSTHNQHQKKKFQNTSKTPLSNVTTSMKGKFGSDSDDESTSFENDYELDDDDSMEYYNDPSYHNIEKISTSKNSTSYKKAKVVQKETSAKKNEKLQKRTGKSLNRKRQKHEVLLKLFIAWMEYLLKFIKWLGILIYDVFYLSCGIILDRLSWCYQCTERGLDNVRSELSGNPGKTAWLWVKNKWIRFDARFDKKSKWAFWRWMFKRKAVNQEQSKDNFKDGKLPKTADEAMKSLLNCKGKDAYR